MSESPEMQTQLVSAHGMLVIIEVLESKPGRDVVLKLLRIVNLVCGCCLSCSHFANTTAVYYLASDSRCWRVGKLLSPWVGVQIL